MKKKRGEGHRNGGAGKMPNGLTVGVFLIMLIGFGAVSAHEAKADLADHVVINEVSIEGVGADGSYDDWVELYNPTNQPVILNDWSIQKTTKNGGSLGKTIFNGNISPNGYFLIVRNDDNTSQIIRDAADILATSSPFSLAADNIVYLVDDKNNIASTTNPTDPNIVDFVGMGDALYFEGTTTASNPGVGQSIARIPAGEDTDQNPVDFKVQNTPTPTNSKASSGNDIGGTVLLTITPDAAPAQNINSTDAQIVFQVNGTSTALIKYGLNTGYASSTAPQDITANATTTVSLTGLACATVYHYVIYAANSGATDTDTTGDAVFTTLPCGITLDSLTMTKSSARANNQYLSGWQWEFNITVWDTNETSLKMKFNQWTGAGVLNAGANMQYSVDPNNDTAWHDITANGAYSADGVNIGTGAGRKIKITVRMKVPVGTAAGYYNSSYGILTE